MRDVPSRICAPSASRRKALCGPILLVLLVLLLMPLGPTSRPLAETTTLCGDIQVYFGYAYFLEETTGNQLSIGTDDMYSWQSMVRIVGDTVACEPGYPSWPPCFSVHEVIECESEDLGCGVVGNISSEGGCSTWTSPAIGRWILDPVPDYAVGDTIQVTGVIYNGHSSFCELEYGPRCCIWNVVAVPCPDSLTAVHELSWGRIKSLYDSDRR
jgi:hypothetical protein